MTFTDTGWKMALFPLLVLLFVSCSSGPPTSTKDANFMGIEAQIERTSIPKDGIPALDFPKYISMVEADEWIGDDELVLALVYRGEERVYPLQLMIWHEIINEVLGDDPIMVTYCPLCGSGIAYSRILDGTELLFGNTGQLYKKNMVMYDRNTQSYWTQVEGKAIMGELTGKQLIPISVDTVTWKEWKTIHPGSRVLSRDTGFRRPYGLQGDFREGDFTLFETSDKIRSHSAIYGINIDDSYKAYRDKDLRERGEIIDTLAGTQIKILRTSDGRVHVTDMDTGEEIVKERDYWFAWLAFHPDTELYAP